MWKGAGYASLFGKGIGCVTSAQKLAKIITTFFRARIASNLKALSLTMPEP
jgi:hypothetical protein